MGRTPGDAPVQNQRSGQIRNKFDPVDVGFPGHSDGELPVPVHGIRALERNPLPLRPFTKGLNGSHSGRPPRRKSDPVVQAVVVVPLPLVREKQREVYRGIVRPPTQADREANGAVLSQKWGLQGHLIEVPGAFGPERFRRKQPCFRSMTAHAPVQKAIALPLQAKRYFDLVLSIGGLHENRNAAFGLYRLHGNCREAFSPLRSLRLRGSVGLPLTSKALRRKGSCKELCGECYLKAP